MIAAAPVPALAFRGLCHAYRGGVPVLADVDLEVPCGQFCVLLGASGAGKSTILRAVAGLVQPSSGTVQIEGIQVEPRHLAQVRRRIGLVHQCCNLAGRLSVLDNVCSGAVAVLPWWRVHTKWFSSSLQRRACHLLAEVGLNEMHLHRRACELSGGQQQRVGIARAEILDPALLLADEPVASLDPATSEEILALLSAACRRRGRTVLCSLHQVELARAHADRIVGIHGGRVVFDGAPDELDQGILERIYRGTPAKAAHAVAPIPAHDGSEALAVAAL